MNNRTQRQRLLGSFSRNWASRDSLESKNESWVHLPNTCESRAWTWLSAYHLSAREAILVEIPRTFWIAILPEIMGSGLSERHLSQKHTRQSDRWAIIYPGLSGSTCTHMEAVICTLTWMYHTHTRTCIHKHTHHITYTYVHHTHTYFTHSEHTLYI